MRNPVRVVAVIFVCMLSLAGNAQDSAWHWTVNAEKTGDSSYLFNVQLDIPEDWQVYAAPDSNLGLEPVRLLFDYAGLATPKVEYDIAPVMVRDPLFDGARVNVFKGSLRFQQQVNFTGMVPATLTCTLQGFASRPPEFIPLQFTQNVLLEGGKELATVPQLRIGRPVSECGDTPTAQQNSILTIFLLGFGGGLIALLTPCVFPMVPVTVSFFTNRAATKQEGVRNGILYGTFILGVYLLASLPFHLLKGIDAQLLNTLSTNAGVNIGFFVIFLLFALSFFGLFEIRLPARFTNAAGGKSGIGTTGGIFFMALTLALVSFSCTGPILGSLLVGSLSSSGGAWQLSAGMAGFGLALALPFGLFALFPQWLKKIPSSGQWMEVVKTSLAFVELALAFKFLSNADLVEHWGLLPREIFIGIWALIFFCMGLYLLGVFRRDPRPTGLRVAGTVINKPIGTGRFIAGVITLLFTLYLLPGLTTSKYGRLPLLSGFPPPVTYSIYGKSASRVQKVEPHFVNDYTAALKYARTVNKPLLIDFTGWACVNCRKMEEHVWVEPAIQLLLRDSVVLLSLYVDDRKPSTDGKFRTEGAKWAAFQEQHFNSAAQPLYVMLNPDQQLLTNPVGYTSTDAYKAWLECGLRARLVK